MIAADLVSGAFGNERPAHRKERAGSVCSLANRTSFLRYLMFLAKATGLEAITIATTPVATVAKAGPVAAIGSSIRGTNTGAGSPG